MIGQIVFLFLIGVSINLKVQNGSPGGKIPSLKVYLLTLSPEGEEEIVDSVKVKRGRARFRGVENERRYTIETEYKGIPYRTFPFFLDGDTTITLTVYETTERTDSITVVDVHLAVVEEDGGYRWSEVLSILNTSSYTYFDPPSFYFVFPSKEAVGTFNPVEPPTYRFWEIGEDTLYSKKPLYPGQNVVAYMFYLTDFAGYRVERNFKFPVGNFRVILSEGLALKSPEFTYSGELKRGKVKFKVYQSRKPSRSFQFEIKKRKPIKPFLIPLIAFIVAVIAVVLLLSTKREKR